MKHLTTLIAFLMMIGSQASAFDPADLQRLIDTGDCAECRLRGANLEGANLNNANIYYAKMRGAFLCNTSMPDGSRIYSGC